MVNVYDENHCSVVGVQKVQREEVKRYGVISGTSVQEGLWEGDSFVEKPDPDGAPSDVVVAGRYILKSSIFGLLKNTRAGTGGEIQLTDALSAQAQSEKVLAYQIRGKRYDCGGKLGYPEATVELAVEHPLIGEAFLDYLARYVTSLRARQ